MLQILMNVSTLNRFLAASRWIVIMQDAVEMLFKDATTAQTWIQDMSAPVWKDLSFGH